MKLKNISTIDGRENQFISDVKFSEFDLYKKRAYVEIEYLISFLSTFKEITDEDILILNKIKNEFDPFICHQYDQIGRNNIGPLQHDVKSVEFALKEYFENNNLEKYIPYIHFAVTSEDINNISYCLLLHECFTFNVYPKINKLKESLSKIIINYANSPVIGKTHGVNASPTTFGKRFSYFLSSINQIEKYLRETVFSCKFSGAVGNYSATEAVGLDFENFAKQFVESFGFVYENVANQRSNHISISRKFNDLKLLNNVLSDLCDHIRQEVLLGYIKQKPNENHVGSSVMPHKVNPWLFEVANGYLEQSSCMIDGLPSGVIQSMFERDLTDHPWERSYGEIISKTLISLNYIISGLEQISINTEFALNELKENPEVYLEAIQTIGRFNQQPNIYMEIKEMSRGKSLCYSDISKICEKYNIKSDFDVTTYTGKASSISLSVVEDTSVIDTVLFDFDDTLTSGSLQEMQEKINQAALLLNVKPIKVNYSWNENVYQFLKLNEIKKEDFIKAINESNHITDEYIQPIKKSIDLVINYKQKGYKVGIVSNRGNSIHRILRKLNLHKLFDIVVDCTYGDHIKPSGKSILYAMNALQTKSHNTIYIGDHEFDFQAAKDAGVLFYNINEL